MSLNVGDLVNITLRGTLYNQRVMTSYGFKVTSSSTGQDVLLDQIAIANALSSDTGVSIVGTYLACVSPALTINEIWVQRIWPVRQIKTIKAVALPGLRGFGNLTPNVAAVVTRRTNLSGRAQISNLHLPGVPLADDAVGGVWDADMKAALELHAFESYDTFTVNTGAGSVTLKGVIIQGPHGSGNNQEITSHLVNPNVRVMRRRTVGLGE